MKYKYIYGPVPSRRLGFSLGIDIIPFKNCSFDCIYCQLGRTMNKTIEQREYTPQKEILKEIKKSLRENKAVDYVTFSGSGEPTLHSKIGHLIKEVKMNTELPVAVLTNGSLLFMPDVQQTLLDADVILPTLCTMNPEIFQKIHRPHLDITIDKIIQGLINFRKIYKGNIWLEIMFVKGVNDAHEEIKKLQKVINRIEPDKIQLNTVVRPPSKKNTFPLSIKELKKIRDNFGNSSEIVARFVDRQKTSYFTDQEKRILDIIKRRPITIDDICSVTDLHKNEITKHIDHLITEGKIKLARHSGQNYYEAI